MIMLATTATKRIHSQERSPVVDTRLMILRITHHLIRTCNVPQRLKIGHHRCRIRIKSHVLTMFRPKRITGHAKHNLIRSHLLYKSTSFRPLSWIYISQTSIFICTEHTARHLPKNTAYQMMHPVRSLQIC